MTINNGEAEALLDQALATNGHLELERDGLQKLIAEMRHMLARAHARLSGKSEPGVTNDAGEMLLDVTIADVANKWVPRSQLEAAKVEVAETLRKHTVPLEKVKVIAEKAWNAARFYGPEEEDADESKEGDIAAILEENL